VKMKVSRVLPPCRVDCVIEWHPGGNLGATRVWVGFVALPIVKFLSRVSGINCHVSSSYMADLVAGHDPRPETQ